MSWCTTHLIAAFLLPPLCLLALLIAMLVIFSRYPFYAWVVVSVVIALLWLAATPYFAQTLLHSLESCTKALPRPATNVQAMVILGGGTYFQAPDYANSDEVNEVTLARLRYGAKLYRDTSLPILVTGGRPLGNLVSEAEQMQKVLTTEFQVPVRWLEPSSNNTLENAQYSFHVLHPQQINHIYLVTHARHMCRAALSFRRVGFHVTEAPTAFTTRYQTNLSTFVPSASALLQTSDFIHEVIGLLWYKLRLYWEGIF